MPPIRRGDDGPEFGPSWDAIVENKIREAIEEGAFDNLPGMGRPQTFEDNPFAGDMRMGFHVMKNAGVAPLWIELSREVQARLDRREAFLERVAQLPARQRKAQRSKLRDEYLQQIAELNEAIQNFNLVVPFAWLQKLPLALEGESWAFDQRFPGDEQADCRR